MFEEEKEEQAKEIISKEINDFNKLVLNITEKIPSQKEYYSKIEKDAKGNLIPRIPGIFILFDNVEFYFQQFQKYKFFSCYKTTIPKAIEKLENPEKIFNSIEKYLKDNTTIEAFLSAKKINLDDIISDYILYFISKREKLMKDSCDIKYIFQILFNLIQIRKKNNDLDGYKYFSDVIILFNCFSSHITYSIKAIKFLNDEKIIDDIYTKILKGINKFEKEKNILFILIETIFDLLINEILLDYQLISKLDYIHLFLMNIINMFQLPNKSFYLFMQFKALYKLIKLEGTARYLKNVYSEIYKLKDVFSEPKQKEKALNAYQVFYEKVRTDFKINNYDNMRHFIVDFFAYELQKYQENEKLFPIIMDVLCEDNGNGFRESNKIFNIFLKRYIFEKPPKNEIECKTILKNSYLIKKEIKIEEERIREEEEERIKKEEEERIKKEEEERIKKEEEKMDDNIIKLDVLKKEEKPEEPEEEKEDLFLKKYNEIINTKGNQKIKVTIDEIIQQVFGFYFNGYFMSYLDRLDYTHSFEDIGYSVFNDNKLFLKACIDFLEDIEKPFEDKKISIFLANAFIQSFLNIFVKYFMKNINGEKEYKGNYDLDNIFNIIKGRSKFRRVIQIYAFRLIYNNIKDKTYEKFKDFKVKSDAYNSFLKQFCEKYSFDDPPFKLKFYCKKIFEDFFNDDSNFLPTNYVLHGYDFDNGFPYDNNIVNTVVKFKAKIIDNKEISSSINCYENNSQLISRLAVLIISNASKNWFIEEGQFEEINEEIETIFKKNNKYINTIINKGFFELTGNLHLKLIDELNKTLLNNSDLTKNFEIENNDTKKYNQRVLGIFLYALKISLTIFIFDDREKYFYSYLIMTENSEKNIINILDNSFIPGYNSGEKGLKNQSKSKDFYSSEGWQSPSLSNLTLKFILFSNLFFILLTKKLDEKIIYEYTIDKKYSCLKMLFFIWNALEEKLSKNDMPVIEIYFNLIIKYFPFILKKCTMETVKNRDDNEQFEKIFGDFINACKNNYKEYSLNFIDTKMKCIIKELNNPLKYNFAEFPFLSYYTVQAKPNRDDLIKKIGNNHDYLILNNLFSSKSKDKIRGVRFKINLINLGKYFAYSINDNIIINLNHIDKYQKLYESILETDEFHFIKGVISKQISYGKLSELEEDIKKSIDETNEKLLGLINDNIKYDSNFKYLFNEIYEEKELFNSYDFEFINFEMSEISKYNHYNEIIYNYISRNCIKSDLNVDYFDYKNYNIDLTELDEHLFSIFLFNKKVLLDVDYSKKKYIPRFDLFNKKYNNQNFLKNFLYEYPAREELTKDQIININKALEKIINGLKISEVKNKFENDVKIKISELEQNIIEKKTNLPNEEDLKYEKLLEIKNIEKEIDKNENIIDILNYKYDIMMSSTKTNYIIDICFALQNLMYYIYLLNLDENLPLIYICTNLQLFRFEKDKLIQLFEENNMQIKLSQLFALYEYFEALIFPEFIYQINIGYMTHVPLYLSQKLLYIFEKDELKKNIIFTKNDLIEAIRKCLCRYIVSSVIKNDFFTEKLDKDLFGLLLKEDLWNKNIDMNKLKESFDYINNYTKFPLKIKHVFNIFEILINIESKKYFSFDNFKEEDEENKVKYKEENEDVLIFGEKVKENEKKKEEKKEEEIKEKQDDDKSEISIEDCNEYTKKEIKVLKRRKKYIYDLLKNSKLLIEYKELQKKAKKDFFLKDLLIEILNHGTILDNDKLIKNFNDFVESPKIDIKITSFQEKKDILKLDEDISSIIVFNKNKLIVSYYNSLIKIFSFNRKKFRKEFSFIPLEIQNLREIQNLEKVSCMIELINGSLLLGTNNGFIINLEISEVEKEVKPKNKIKYIAKVKNQTNLENNNNKINELIEINNNMFISNDEDNNNILWENFKLKKKLEKGKVSKVKNTLIIINEKIFFYDIKNNFEESGKIEKKIRNQTILNDNYIVAEDDSSWSVHLFSIVDKKEIKELKYKPEKAFILKKICDKWFFKLEKNELSKLIKLNLNENNNNSILEAENEQSMVIENGYHLINLFDEVFLVNKKNGNVNCYGLFYPN